jgi:TolB-like protein
MTCALTFAQAPRRVAIVEANGQLARSAPIYTLAESRVTDELTEKLASKPGFTVVDRASVDKIIKEQNFQNSDRSSSDTAVRIGKLLGVGQIVLVNMYDASLTTHQEGSRNMGTQTLRVNVRMIDVETGVILAQPSAQFQETVLLSETSSGYQIGAIKVPAKQKGGDPKVIIDNEWTKACDSVTTDLAAKLETGMGSAPGPKRTSALVAGIANGSVYINQGSAGGIKAADKFQVVREVSVGLNDPATGKPIVQKQTVCVLTVVNVNETSASGTCAGGLPQSKDVAEPMP